MLDLIGWVLEALLLAVAGGITLWVAGAIYFDFFRRPLWNRLFAVGWLVGVVLLFAAWQPLWQPFVVLVAVAAGVVAAWLRIEPSHDREWDPAVATLPRARLDGDAVTVQNVRDFEYRSAGDFTPRYDTRTYHVGNLNAADIIFFNWGSAWMSHPVLVFDFGAEGRICMSIEVRYRKGQRYAIVRSLYRQQELIFLAADERDVILRRTKHGGNQTALLYRIRLGVEEIRTAFLDYVGAINAIHARPRWYNGLTTSCTTSYYRLPNSRFR